MPVSEHGAPPRRVGVEVRAATRVVKARALGASHDERLGFLDVALHRRVRVPHVALVELDDAARVRHGNARMISASASPGLPEGTLTLTVVPEPSLLSMASVPPCASMMRTTMGRPRPVPLGRVVKNGSVARLRTSAPMPRPES